jgi:hypothetical protein
MSGELLNIEEVQWTDHAERECHYCDNPADAHVAGHIDTDDSGELFVTRFVCRQCVEEVNDD